MSIISPKEFMKFCISQGFEFVLVNHENKVINKDNLEELDSIFEKNQGSSWMCRRMQNAKNMVKTWSNQSESAINLAQDTASTLKILHSKKIWNWRE